MKRTKRILLLLMACVLSLASGILFSSCDAMDYIMDIVAGNVTDIVGGNGNGGGTVIVPGTSGKDENEDEEYYVVEVQMVTAPTISEYGEGDIFDPTGMVLKVIWNDGYEQLLKDGARCRFSPSAAITSETTEIKATFDDKTFTLPIHVNRITGIQAVSQPSRTLYAEGESFSSAGLEIYTLLENGEVGKIITDYTLSENASELSASDTKVTVNYEYQSETLTCDIPVTVLPADNLCTLEAEAGIVVNGKKVTSGSSVLQYTSNNGFVRNLVENGTITINVPAAKATTADLRFVLSSHENDPNGGAFTIPIQLNEAVTITFNGEEIEIGDDEILPGGYDDERGTMSRHCHWYEISLDNVQLNEGDNLFVITSKVDMSGSDEAADLHSILFDCLRVFYADATAIPGAEPEGPVTLTTTTYQAEDLELSGIVVATSSNLFPYMEAAGDTDPGFIKDFTEGSTLTLSLNLAEAAKVKISIYGSSVGGEEITVNSLINKVTLNGTEVTYSTGTCFAAHTDADGSTINEKRANFKEYVLGEYDFVTGDNTLVITFKATSACFIDRVVVTSVTEGEESDPQTYEKIFEAENGYLAGCKISNTGKVAPYCSNNTFVYGFSENGMLLINVPANEDTIASLYFVLSSYEGGANNTAISLALKDYLTISFNGTEISLENDVLPGGSDVVSGDYSRFCHWYEVKLENVQLNEGDNFFIITSKVDMNDENDKHSTVFDYLRVVYAEKGSIGDDSTDVAPKAPISATYTLDNETDGMADGTVSIVLPSLHFANDIYMWWGDDNGKLAGYTSLARFKVDSFSTTNITHEMTANTLIPEGATRLLIYTYNDNYGLSDEFVSVDLPEGAASGDFGEIISEFQIVGDIHVQESSTSVYNRHFIAMLNDIIRNSPNTLGIFTVGDNVDRYYDGCWTMFDSLYASVDGAPPMYLGIGNHEYMTYTGHAEDMYEENLAKFLAHSTLPDGSHPERPWFDFWLNGYHYVYLGSETATQKATLSDEQLAWLDETLAENRDGRPIFIILHQAMLDTVSGSSAAEGWGDVINPEKLKAVLDKYPEAIMFNGHSHWILDSANCMYDGNGETATIFNTSSVGYLWQSYDKVTGEYLEGSEGYYIRIYKDKVLVLGRDFVNGEWISSAQFVVSISTPESSHTHTGETVEGKAATCTETGLTDGIKCSECGETIKYQKTIPALGHDWDVEVIKELTDATGGENKLTCKRDDCGESYTELAFQAEYAELSGAKKWSGDEMSQYSYLGNGYVYGFSKDGTLTIKWTSAISTTATLRFAISSYENDSSTKTLSLKANEYLTFTFNSQTLIIPDSAIIEGGVDYDVDGDGAVDNKSRYARWCDVVIENVQIIEGENVFVITSLVNMSDASDKHSSLFDCLKVQYESIEHTHSYTLETVKDEALKSEATCTDKAVYYKSCECGAIGDSETFEYGEEPAGHDFTGEWLSDKDGHWHVCATEGCDVTDEKQAHTFGDWTKVDDTNHERTCECGEKKSAEHDWDNGEVTQAPTTEEEGVKTYTCTECKATQTETIEKLIELILEAEDGVIDGGKKVTSGSSILQYTSNNGFVRNLVENGTITINVPAAKATTADLRFVLSSHENDPNGGAFTIPVQLNEAVTITFNGEEIEIGDDEILPGGYDDERGTMSRHCHWYEIKLDNVQLNEGDNLFVITSKVDMSGSDEAADLHSTLFDCLRVLYTEADAILTLTTTTYQAEDLALSGIATTVKANGNSSGLFKYMEAAGDTDPGFVKDFTANSTMTLSLFTKATKVKISIYGSSVGGEEITVDSLINKVTLNGTEVTYSTGTCFVAHSGGAQNMANFNEYVLGEYDFITGDNTLVITFNATSACFIDRVVVTPVEV